VIDFLTLVIIGIAILQPTRERMAVALVFASFTFVHNTFLYELEGLMYYASDALFYLLIILLIGSVDKPSILSVELQKICLAAIALDYFGWCIWILYIPPTGYNVAFMALYAWTIIILLKKEPAHDGSNAMDSRLTSIQPYAHSGHTLNSPH